MCARIWEATFVKSFGRNAPDWTKRDLGAQEAVGSAMIRLSVRLIWAACWSIPLAAQTQVDLRTQSKSVDF